MVQCDLCGEMFKNSQGLGGHVALAHRIRPEDLEKMGVAPEALKAVIGSPSAAAAENVAADAGHPETGATEASRPAAALASGLLATLSAGGEALGWLLLLALAALLIWALWRWYQQQKAQRQGPLLQGV